MKVWELISLLASLEDQDAIIMVWNSSYQKYVPAAGVKSDGGFAEIAASTLENMS